MLSQSHVKKHKNFKLQDLPAATSGVVSVSPESSLKEAVTKMVTNDFSQLPVMISDTELNGFISWQTIGVSILFGAESEKVRGHMDKNAPSLPLTENLLDAVRHVLDKDFVFVKDSENKITGIVTLYDISSQFQLLSEPFIILQHIELSIRKFISDHLDEQDVKRAYEEMEVSPKKQERSFKSMDELTFGEYLSIIGSRHLWERFGTHLDRKAFIKKLDTIRSIRNEVMHFKTDGISKESLKHLKDVSKFFRMLESVRMRNDPSPSVRGRESNELNENKH